MTDRFSPRWEVDWPARVTKVEFCQQVGAYDVWLTPDAVLLVSEPKVQNCTQVIRTTEYSYEHAAQRFPLIEHKIMAMRSMLFGVISNE